MYKIVVVDDDFFNITVMTSILEDEYEITSFRSGDQVLAYLQGNPADLILLDYLMPGKDGMEVLSELRKNSRTASIPVIVLTASQDVALETAFLKAGAEDFITKPFSPDVVRSRISRILDLNAIRENLQMRLNEKTRQMENVLLQAFTTVANIVDAKDDFKEDHSIHVARYAAAIAKKLGWKDKEVQNIYYSGLLHDIGKISVPDRIIRKNGSLSEKEWKVMRGHTSVGAEMLKDVHMVKMADAVALYHHEKYDGTGYPRGLKGDEIPLEARIVNIANAYDAMCSSRIYHNRFSKSEIIEELHNGSGTEFDPSLVEIVIKMIEDDSFEKEALLADSLQDIKIGAEEGSSQLLFKVLEANSKAVKREAMKDSLTGLYNREYAEKYVNTHLSQCQHCAYFMIDLDNFKMVNDRFGHIAGDYALKNVANMLSEMARNYGIACRMGGDEFSLFIHQNMSRKELHKLAASLLAEYNRIKVGNESIADTSLSIGIALMPEDGNSYQELYNAADKALYLSKRGGKNRYCFFNEGEATQTEVKETEMDLQRLMEMLQLGNFRKGSYKVPYKDFQRIYSFIIRCIERNKQSAQLLLLSLKSPSGGFDSPDMLEEEIRNLELAVVNSLRRNDVSTRYSSSQILVVLVDGKEAHVDKVIQRILDTYEALKHHGNYTVKTERMSLSERLKES